MHAWLRTALRLTLQPNFQSNPTHRPPAPVQVTVSYDYLVVGEATEDAVATVPSNGRRLLQDNQIVIPLPAGFTPQKPADLPNVLIPLVFHVMLYS